MLVNDFESRTTSCSATRIGARLSRYANAHASITAPLVAGPFIRQPYPTDGYIMVVVNPEPPSDALILL
jgi:hypothetical protein